MSNAADPLVIQFASLRCVQATAGPGKDQPYALFFVVDSTPSALPLPVARAFRTRIFQNNESTGDGDVRFQTVPTWGLAGTPAPIVKASNIIVLAAVIEHDKSEDSAVFSAVQALPIGPLTSGEAARLPRSQLVSGLLQSMAGAIQLGVATGALNQDDVIGDPQELAFSDDELGLARAGVLTKSIEFFGDGGHYQLHFEIKAVPGWHGWEDLGGDFVPSPAVCSWGPVRLDLFARKKDNSIWHSASNNGGSDWSGWFDFNIKATGEGATCRLSDSLDFLSTGLNKKLDRKTWTGNGWTASLSPGAPGELLTFGAASAPAVCCWDSERIDVFMTGLDGALWHVARNSSEPAWSGWSSLGGHILGAPAAVSRGKNSIDVFVRGQDRQIGRLHWNGFGWVGWQALGAPLGLAAASRPAAASWNGSRRDVFVLGSSGVLFHNASTDAGATWSGWFPQKGSPAVALQGDPAAVSRTENRIDVFAVGIDDHMHQITFTN